MTSVLLLLLDLFSFSRARLQQKLLENPSNNLAPTNHNQERSESKSKNKRVSAKKRTMQNNETKMFATPSDDGGGGSPASFPNKRSKLTEPSKQKGKIIGDSSSFASKTEEEATKEERKERFLLLTRVLIKYLEKKDPTMHKRAKDVIRKCTERRKAGETAFMQKRLRETVGERYWKFAESYLHHYSLKQKSEETKQDENQEEKKEEYQEKQQEEPKEQDQNKEEPQEQDQNKKQPQHDPPNPPNNYEERATNFARDLLAIYDNIMSGTTTDTFDSSPNQSDGPSSNRNLQFDTVGNMRELVQLTARFMEQHERMVRQHAQQQHSPKRESNVSSSTFTDTRVLIGYHATDSMNLPSIGQRGLLSGTERDELNVESHRGIWGMAAFGQGIYLANNPHAFSGHSDACVMVAMIQGRTEYVGGGVSAARKLSPKGKQQGVATVQDEDEEEQPPLLGAIVGNKCAVIMGNVGNVQRQRDEIVLQKSNQCLALIQACLSTRTNGDGTPQLRPTNIASALMEEQASFDLIWAFHIELQKLMDKYFNNLNKDDKTFSHVTTRKTKGRSPFPVRDGSKSTGMSVDDDISCVHVVKPLFPPIYHESLTFEAGSDNNIDTDKMNELMKCFETTTFHSSSHCLFCLDSLSKKGVVCRLGFCQHEFHRKCLWQHIQNIGQWNCPKCHGRLWEFQEGTSPSGTMTVLHPPNFAPEQTTNDESSSSKKCPKIIRGLQYSKSNDDAKNHCENIEIIYNMPAGVQAQHHPDPGASYSSIYKMAYLPNNEEGRTLLKRLKYAFRRGLTFTFGTLSSSSQNKIVWSSIPHVTWAPSLFGEYFFQNCHRELDKLGVPPANEL